MFHTLKRKIRILLLTALLPTSSVMAADKDHNLTDAQLHAVIGIITNFILSDGDVKKPIFTSTAHVDINENTTVAVTLTAADSSTVTYGIHGGNSADFDVNATTGVVTFKNPPDYESGVTSYAFTSTATDTYGNTATQEVIINIVDEEIVHNSTIYETVTSPYTGKVWLDRNLGASQVCTAYNDMACYGDYYQWGRDADGHEDNESGTTATQATDVTAVGHGDFITSNNVNDYDWAKTVDATGTTRVANWSNTNGFSVCPANYRVPNITELRAETLDEDVIDRDTAFTSFLKIPSAGIRYYLDGDIYFEGSWVNVWAGSVDASNSHRVVFGSESGDWYNEHRASGVSVRCLRD